MRSPMRETSAARERADCVGSTHSSTTEADTSSTDPRSHPERDMSATQRPLTTGRTSADRNMFLAHFPNKRRAFITNLFLFAVRRGRRTPLQVVDSVEDE